jgi:hypothetical protein
VIRKLNKEPQPFNYEKGRSTDFICMSNELFGDLKSKNQHYMSFDFISFTQNGCENAILEEVTPKEMLTLTMQEDLTVNDPNDGLKEFFVFCMN